jgi:hypothetical protein
MYQLVLGVHMTVKALITVLHMPFSVLRLDRMTEL